MEMGSFCRPKMQNAKKTWKRVSSINPEMVNTIASEQEHWDSLGRTALNYERLDAFPKKRSPKDIYVLTHSKHVVNVVMLSAINFFTEPILSIFSPISLGVICLGGLIFFHYVGKKKEMIWLEKCKLIRCSRQQLKNWGRKPTFSQNT